MQNVEIGKETITETTTETQKITLLQHENKHNEPFIIRGKHLPECLRNETLADILTATANRIPHKTALIFQNESITYEELNHRANLVAHYLIAGGVKCGDLVGLWLPRGIRVLA